MDQSPKSEFLQRTESQQVVSDQQPPQISDLQPPNSDRQMVESIQPSDNQTSEVVLAQTEIVQGDQQIPQSQLNIETAQHTNHSRNSGPMEQSAVIRQKAAIMLQQSMIYQPVEEEEPVEPTGMDEDYYYPEDHNENLPAEDAPLPDIHPDTIRFYDCYGMDSLKRNNLLLIDDQTFVYASAISYQFYNFRQGSNQIFFSRDSGGIGTIAVHPSKQFYAIGEKGTWPNVYVYSKDHKLYRILRKGTEKSYSNSVFSKDGTRFATVGSQPDYQICIWDWKQETILLKAKAFSQEVYKVSFSDYNAQLLCTSGMGHIKFWKVAETFTGLKLKGEIGKFGQVELSDVDTAYIFPDGKVLSATEYGRLILWEGNVIKIVVGESEEVGCHEGGIESIFLYKDCIISGGKDGYLKAWKMQELDQAEGDDRLNYYTQPVKSLVLQDGEEKALILTVVQAESFWLVGDQGGRVWRVDWENEKSEIVYKSNSGPQYDLALSHQMNAAISVCDDGGIRLWNYVNNELFYERKFPAKATCVQWMPFTMRNQGRVIVVGFSNGIVRFLLLNQKEMFLLKTFKVHPHAVQSIKISSDQSLVAVLSSEGEIFFIKYSDLDLQDVQPYCLWETKLQISDMSFNQSGDKLLLGSKDGRLYQCEIPKDIDNSENYLVEFNPQSYLLRMMEDQKPKKEDLDLQFLMKLKDDKMPDVEWDPEAILNSCYYQDEKILCTAIGKYLGNCYIIDVNKERPIERIPIQKVNTLHISYQDEILLIGYVNGSWEMRHRSNFTKPILKQSHDMDYGRIRKLSLNYDKSAILSVSDDGTLYIYQLDFSGFLKQLQGEECDEFVFKELDMGINSTTFSDEIQLAETQEEDILDDKIYSIQQAKLLAEEDNRRNEADKKKDTVKSRIMQLREQFQALRQKNNTVDEAAKLTEEELCVDPEYKQMLLERVAEDVEETRKELEWDRYYAKLKTEKLKSYMIDELEVDKFLVKGFKNSSSVNTFKVKKLSEFIKDQLKETYRLIEEEKKNQENNQIQQLQQPSSQQVPVNLQRSQLKISQVVEKEEKQHQHQHQHQIERKEDDGKVPQAKVERERLRQEEERIRKEQELLEKTKPTKESFEPDHLRDIQEAIETLGDFKLKSSKDYVVPENQRMNVSKKRKHMYMLEEFIYNTKVKFNQQLLNLKKRKQDIIAKVKKYNLNIKKINEQLGKQEQLFQPEIDKELEDPLYYLEVTDEQITEYANKQNIQQKKDDVKRIAPPQVTKPADTAIKTRKGIRVQQSQLEDEMKEIQEMVLNAEKQRMLEEIQDEVSQFDKDVVKCQNEKNVLESDMLIASMKLVTFYQELLILEDMEEFDNKLIKELLDYKKEKNNLDQQSEKIIEKLQALSKSEQENEKLLNVQLKEWKELVYPDDEVKREKIHQYFYRRYKRDKARKLKREQENNEDSDDEEKDDEDAEEEDDYLSEEDDEEKPDPSLENDNKVKDVIDKICEYEENQENCKKEKQDNERLKIQIGNKIQLVLKDLKRADDDLRAYQRKKLQRVNQLDVSYILKLSQIQNLDQANKLPNELQSSILFTDDDFYQLCKRIVELEQEQKKIEKQKKQKEKTKTMYEREIKHKDLKIEDLNKKYEEKHMLKFGDIIDLKILDALEPTKAVLDMRAQFQIEEKEAQRKLARAKEELSRVKQSLLEVKRENTKIFTNITKLGRQQMELSKKLTSGNKQLFKGDNNQKKTDLEGDKQNLQDLVKFLGKEIEDLKDDIGKYKQKGGHIYTNVTVTKSNFAQRQG